MLEQELKEIWKHSSDVDKIKFETSRLMIDMESTMKKMSKAIVRRDNREIGASIAGIIGFSYFAYEIPFPITKFAAMFGVLWFFYVIYKFKKTQKKKVPIDASLTFVEQLEHQKAYMIVQAQLLNSVLYWYVLPPLIMNYIFIYGLGNPVDYQWTGPLSFFFPISINLKIAMLAGNTFFSGLIVWLNTHTCKKQIYPVIQEIEQVLFQLKNTN
jgi:hypothetical protein